MFNEDLILFKNQNHYTFVRGGLLALTCFSSCENFLDNDDIKKEIEESIEIANSSAITYYVTADEGSGTVTPEQIKAKKKENFDLRFKPASDWKFICWEVINKTSGEVVENAIKFDNPDQPETKAHVVNPKEGLLIHAKCVQIPTIIEYTPQKTANANQSITVKFNMPVEAAETDSSASFFNFQNISLTCNDDDLSYCFETPVLNSDKTELTIVPKSTVKDGVLLRNFMIDRNLGVVNLDVIFSSSIVIESGDSQLSISNPAFTVNFIPTIETTPPERKVLFLTRESNISLDNAEGFDTEKRFSGMNLARKPDGITPEQYDKLVMQNACNGTFYIYGRYVDDDSGVKSVVVTEKRTNDSLGDLVTEVAKDFEYNKNSPEALFVTNAGETRFLIKHVCSSENGAYSITVSVSDFCGNQEEIKGETIKKYTVIKNNISPLMAYMRVYLTEPSVPDNSWIDYETYNAQLLEYYSTFSCLFEHYDWHDANDVGLYYTVMYPLDKFNIFLDYIDTSSTRQIRELKLQEDGYGDYTVRTKFNDLSLETVVKAFSTDFLGNRSETIVNSFADPNTIINLNITKHDDYADVEFYQENGMPANGLILIRYDSDGKAECSKQKRIDKDYTYKILYDAGVILKNTFSFDTKVDNENQQVSIKNINITKSKQDNSLTATVQIDEDAWTSKKYDSIWLEFDGKNIPLNYGNTKISVDFSNSKIYEDNVINRTVTIT